VIETNHEGEGKPQIAETTRTDKGQRNLKTTVLTKLIKHTYNVEQRLRRPDSRTREHPISQIKQGNTMGMDPANRNAIRLQGNHKR